MTEWVLVVNLIYAIGYAQPEMPDSMSWPMPSHAVCIDVATKLFPQRGGNQIQIATCVEKHPEPSAWGLPKEGK